MNLRCPIYFSTGMTEKANHYYKMFISWTNEKFRKAKIKDEHGLECYMPANGETAIIPAKPSIPAKVSVSLLKQEASLYSQNPPDNSVTRLLHGVLVMKPDSSLAILDPESVNSEYKMGVHTVRFTSTVSVQSDLSVQSIIERLQLDLKPVLANTAFSLQKTGDSELTIQNSVMVQVDESDENMKDIRVSWTYAEDTLGSTILK